MSGPYPLLTLASCGLIALSGCTSDLPAPFNYEDLDLDPAPDDLVIDCAALPLTAVQAQYDHTPIITGLVDDEDYRYTVTDGELPAGLMLDDQTGAIQGQVSADPGTYAFEITVESAAEPDLTTVGACSLLVRERLAAPLALDTVPYCLSAGDDLRRIVRDGTGDDTPITCSAPGGNGNGRVPAGIEIDAEGCTIAGTIEEDRLGTWVFMMRAIQSGVDIYVPYCATNDEAQGFSIQASHSGVDDATLLPIVGTYSDPDAPFEIGEVDNPRVEVLDPQTCGSLCFFRYSFLRTNAPIANDGFTLSPDGLVPTEDGTQSRGFFHSLSVSGPQIPEAFRGRPWSLSVAIEYCLSSDPDGCDDVSANSDGAYEMSVIMVPESL